MKALVKYASGEGNVEIREVEEPRCGDDQVKLEIAYCGICGTDIHVLHDTFRNYPPVILGHEFSGTVVEVGRNVNHHAALGERVTGLGATAVTCGQCEYCLSGYFIFCSNRRGMGHGVNGAFTRYVVMRPISFIGFLKNFLSMKPPLRNPSLPWCRQSPKSRMSALETQPSFPGPDPWGCSASNYWLRRG